MNSGSSSRFVNNVHPGESGLTPKQIEDIYKQVYLCYSEICWWFTVAGRERDKDAFVAAFKVVQKEASLSCLFRIPPKWAIDTLNGFYLEFSSAQHVRGAKSAQTAVSNIQELEQILNRLKEGVRKMY